MSGSQYVALSGLRSQMNALDRLADDISNIDTAGYKGQRNTRQVAERDAFDASLQTAIDTTFGASSVDTTAGTMLPTGRPLDLAIDGEGFFAVQTAHGVRYTRNGHFGRGADGTLTSADGAKVLGADGPITLGAGEVRIDEDGTIWSGATASGRVSVVTFADPQKLRREGVSLFAPDGMTPTAVSAPVLRDHTLEQSNVSMNERLVELTTVSRNFEALQKSISVLMNDVDGRAIEQLGRR